MADTGHDREIEDVLSSVRRLISDEPESGVAPPAQDGADKLILTQALRVPSGDDDAPTLEEQITELESVLRDGTTPAANGKGQPTALPDPPLKLDSGALVETVRLPDDDGPVGIDDDEDDIVEQVDAAPGADATGPDAPSERPLSRDPAPRSRQVFDNPDDVIITEDEELQSLVAALIRDELQGELGERITRNVRKLVRREIARALSARDLD